MGTSADPGLHDYSTTAASNDTAGDVNWAENQNPNTVNDSARQVLADVRAAYEDLEWVRWGDTTAYVAATQFKIAGSDVTARYLVGRAVKIVGSTTGTIYRYITVSSFSTDTTVTVDSGTIQNETLTVYLGVTSNQNSLLSGSVIQVVNTQDGAVATGSTVMPFDDTIPQNTEGDEYMTLAITPKTTTNKLKIDVICVLDTTTVTDDKYLSMALFQDSTAGALAATVEKAAIWSGSAGTVILTLTHYMAAGTTSATTFKIRAGGDAAGTTTFNGLASGRIFGGVMASSITITEIKA